MASLQRRERLLLDADWRFHRGDFPFPPGHSGWTKAGNFGGAVDPAFDDASWRTVNLPHDFIVEGEVVRNLETPDTAAGTGIAGFVPGQSMYTMHGSLPLGVGWYRKSFLVPDSDLGRRVVIEFDGVARNGTFWLNRHQIGRHLSGFTGARFDVTDVVNYGSVNTLVVRADATEYEGWFYEGGGLYRHAWLVKHGPLHVAADGVFVTTHVPPAGRRTAVTVRTTVRNDGAAESDGEVAVVLVDRAGRTAASISVPLAVPAGAEATVEQTMDVSGPRLWSIDAPNLYTAVVTVRSGGEAVDEVRTTFGIRTIRFDAARGFFLNGKRVVLQGVCCHQDHAGVGVALPDALQEYRIRRLTAMGCNAYRCSHNPPTPELLDVCDRIGMFVMDENRLLSSTAEGLDQLQSLVCRDRNHPSVILWSLANEEPLQGTPVGARIGATMQRLVRQLDPTRPTTMAMNGSWGDGLSAIVDVQGCNYIRCGDIDAFHARFPRLPIVFTESCSTVSTRGVYANDAARGYVSAYDVNVPGWGNTAEDNWLHCRKRPFVAGTFVWTGFDYRGEPTPYSWPCTGSHFGILDSCGFPKDNFHYYRAWWTDRPVLHVFPHWNWPGREGERIAVWVHSNCDRVELFLNGRSLGRKTVRPARHLAWSVPYRPGRLDARGWKRGRLVATVRVETTGAPAALRLMPDRRELCADGEDATVVNVAVVDARGRIVPVADNEMVFTVTANARILGVGNGDPSSHEPDQASRRRAFNGLCQLVLGVMSQAGPVTITAAATGLKPARVTILARTSAPRPAVATAVSRRIRSFECSTLLTAPADITHAAGPKRGLTYAAVTTIDQRSWFCDVRGFHKGRHGLLFIRATHTVAQRNDGQLLYGADGPIRVWVNGRPVDCRPLATNPAVDGQYRAPVTWAAGVNEILFGLVTNHGKAWGVYAGVVQEEAGSGP